MTDSQNTLTDELLSKCIQMPLTNRDLELYDLVKISGITIDPTVFKHIVELLRLDLSPAAVFHVLQILSQVESKPTSGSKRNPQIKNGPAQTSSKKKPPIAAKPKKIRVENSEISS